MSELRTEEEQVELIKNWWKENGNSLLMSIGVAVAVVFGWKAWVANQEANAANASAVYENISSAVTAGSLDDVQRASVFLLGEELKSEFGSSAYAPMASMLLAKVAAESGDLDTAQQELNYVLSNEAADMALKQLANIRLSRVALSQGDMDVAESTLAAAGDKQYPSLYYHLKGDIAYGKGDLSAARDAYAQAMEAADPQSRSLIKLKLDDIAAGDAS